MGSTAILESWLQPLTREGYVSWRLVAEGTHAGLPQHQRNLTQEAWG